MTADTPKPVEAVTREAVLHALSRHIGRDCGTTARLLVIEICGEASSHGERVLRRVVEELRGEGVAICADPGAGYHIAANAEELEACIAFLRGRAMTTLLQLRSLKRVARAQLAGQKRLKV